MPAPIVADLRAEPAPRVRSAAFYHVRELRAGQTLVLVLAEPPDLVMESVDLQLGRRFAWQAAQEAGAWRVEVRLREDLPPTDALDLLARDHRRLDDLLATALRRINAGDVAGARALLEGFAVGARRHMAAENGILAPIFPHAVGADGTDHVQIMLREHQEIDRQLAEVEACLAEEAAAREVEPFVAILSGTLAKHEFREEGNVFPVWAGALARLPDGESAELLNRVQAVLAGG